MIKKFAAIIEARIHWAYQIERSLLIAGLDIKMAYDIVDRFRLWKSSKIRVTDQGYFGP
jgi:hypothetical protein